MSKKQDTEKKAKIPENQSKPRFFWTVLFYFWFGMEIGEWCWDMKALGCRCTLGRHCIWLECRAHSWAGFLQEGKQEST
jgi:hypothetical protein